MARIGLALLVFGSALFSSCQTTSSDKPSGPEDRNLVFADSMTCDSVSWVQGSETFKSKVVRAGSYENKPSWSAMIHLNSPIGSGSLEASLWAYGLRTTVATLKADGSSGLKPSNIRKDSVARALVSLLERRHGVDTTYKLSHEGIVRLYAEQILADKNRLGFPKVVLVGADSLRIVDAILLNLATVVSKLNESSFADLMGEYEFLGNDSAAVRVRFQLLISKGALSKQDSARLFPRYPVWIKADSSVALAKDTLVAGGAKVAVSGTFEAEPKLGLNYLDIKVFDASGNDRTSRFEAISSSTPNAPNGQAYWNLSQRLHLRADSTVVPGEYRLEVTMGHKVSEGKNYLVTSSDAFVVVAPAPPAPLEDRRAPSIETDPSTPKSVATDKDSVLIKVKVSDSSGVKRVRIAGVEVAEKDGSYSRQVKLEVYGPNEFVVDAVDQKGNEGSAKVSVYHDLPVGAKPPVIVIVGSDVVELPFEKDSVQLVWSVKDPTGIKRVSLGGQTLVSENDTFKITVQVPPTGKQTEFRLEAVNTGNLLEESIVKVARSKDETKPVVSIDSASWLAAGGAFRGDSMVIASSQAGFDVGLKVTDNHKVVAVLAGTDTLVKGTDGLYHWKVASAFAGKTSTTILAVDSFGNIQPLTCNVFKRDVVILSATSDQVPFQDSGRVKATSTTPDAVVEYSIDGATWTTVPAEGILIFSSVNIQFRGLKAGFENGELKRQYVVRITPPEESKPAVWNDFDWSDGVSKPLPVWQ